MQYTLRNVPAAIDRALRQRARREGKSLNQIILDTVQRVVGLGGEPIRRRDLGDVAGTWRKDEAFERVLREQDRVDPDKWR